MSGMVGGFIEGVFAGMDWREARDNRKRVRKMEDEQFDWRREAHGWDRENQQYTSSERERVRREREAELAAWGKTADQMLGVNGEPGAEEPRQSTAGASPARERAVGPRDGVSVKGGDLSFGLPSMSELEAQGFPVAGKTARAPQVGVGANGAPAQAQATAAGTPREMGVSDAAYSIGHGPGQADQRIAQPANLFPNTPQPQSPGGSVADQFTAEELARLNQAKVPGVGAQTVSDAMITARGQIPNAPRATPIGQITEVDQKSSSFMQDMQGIKRGGDIQKALDGIASDLNWGNDGGPASSPIARGLGGITDYFTETPEKAGQNATERAARGEASKWYRSTEALDFFSKNPEALTEAKANPVGFFAGMNADKKDLPDKKKFTAREPVTLSFGDDIQPSGERAARESLYVLGANGAIPATKQQRDRAAKDGQAMFNREQVPPIVEHYIRTGQIEKAKAFQDWVKTESVQKGIKSYMAASHALALGDEKGAEMHLREVYNNQDYFDDGYSVPEDGVDIVMGADGKPKGARIRMVNDATGESYVQELDDQEFMLAAYRALDPVNVFNQSIAAIAEVEKAAAKKRAEGQASLKIEDAMKIVTDAVKAVNENVLDPNAFQQFTMEEIIDMAQLLSANPTLNPVTIMEAMKATREADPTGGFRRQ